MSEGRRQYTIRNYTKYKLIQYYNIPHFFKNVWIVRYCCIVRMTKKLFVKLKCHKKKNNNNNTKKNVIIDEYQI